jgi:hypothetical protein
LQNRKRVGNNYQPRCLQQRAGRKLIAPETELKKEVELRFLFEIPQIHTTETSPQDDYYVMTRTRAANYLQITMKGLQYTKAFVIQFRDSTEPGAVQLPGRVEHVASGRTATFQSVEELPQLLQKMLNSVRADDEYRMG